MSCVSRIKSYCSRRFDVVPAITSRNIKFCEGRVGSASPREERNQEISVSAKVEPSALLPGRSRSPTRL